MFDAFASVSSGPVHDFQLFCLNIHGWLKRVRSSVKLT